MRLIEDPKLDRFRAECRDWLQDNVPTAKRPPDGLALREYDLAWQRTQYEGGWAGVSWPKEYGGRGLSVLEQLIWHEEYARAGAPPSASMFVALSHAGPTLIVQGSDEQKQRYLPKILKGEENWCQGFSEPGAGSDLASLKTRGVVDGDHLVVTGTKIWTSYAEGANRQELLVRTDPEQPRHRGLTWIVCDMDLPGIDIRPITAMSGVTHFAQVFYDEVRIPLANVVGEINKGWAIAMTTLGFERGTGTIAHQIELANGVERLIEVAGETTDPETGRSLLDDDAVAARLAGLRAEVMALRSLTVASVSRGMREEVPGAEGNIPALYFGELTRRVNGAALEILGPAALARDGEHNWPLHYLESFKWAIGGGTSEIRRNVIGERVLGLPRGPRAI
ncbi:acyl-CoA dehydrogenase family protein [Novosphingobium pentaromativorans]|uniref:Putative acyl-CoA dehydrogenase n=1 Tax=Novosphingobium pentaromativorans US6-1 TaxID=1088721 RepID=G6ECG9_9SPHN|nr:acyl-CoA dehydrogenase family protein [Novosphingobium pentaromativorans]AIT80057.1 acyl-CoA dehydrogenase [Novosphingobium pentaromativorans US6-1]EHJ60880.1 putative acyl-CoA dehydrogenase [Novosphingobium pentaromativorans US6-1]